MKNFLLLIICSYCLIWTACNKEETVDDEEQEEVHTYFKCKINGVLLQRDTLQYYADNLVEGTLFFAFSKGDQRIDLELYGSDESVGTYELDAVNYFDGAINYYGDSGTLVITEANKEQKFMSGTFNGSCSPLGSGADVEITEGEFVVNWRPN